MPKRISTGLRNLYYIAVATIAALALAEGTARVAEWAHPPAPELTFDYAPYRMLRMVRAPWPLNSDGFRARELETYRNKFLIEFLGGSVCLGVGTHPGKTVPERLEEALHQAGMGDASVLNLCQGGATTAQELAIFVQYGLPLSPQFVISFNGANDLMHPAPVGDDEEPNLPYRNREMRAWFNPQHGIAPHLALPRVAARLAKRLPAGASALDVPDPSVIASYIYYLDLTRNLAQDRHATHTVLLQPTLHFEKPRSVEERDMWRERQPRYGDEISHRAAARYRSAGVALARWGRASGENVYDLTHVFAHSPDTIYSDSVHFTGERGYQVLFQALVEQGMIDRIRERYRHWTIERDSPRTVSWLR